VTDACPALVNPIDVAVQGETLFVLQAGGRGVDRHGQVIEEGPYVRALDGEGNVRVIAGNGETGRGGENKRALDAPMYPGLGDLHFRGSAGFDVLTDGSIVFGEARYNRIRRISSELEVPVFEWVEADERHVVPESSGAVAHTFDARGRHLRTVEVATGRTLYAFEYDPDTPTRLVRIIDPLGESTRIQWWNDGATVVAPGGISTRLRVNAEGWLTRWEGPGVDPFGDAGILREFSYHQGLLTRMVAPGAGAAETRTWHYTYDEAGRLLSDADPVAHAAGEAITLRRRPIDSRTTEIIHRSPEGRETGFLTRRGAGGQTLMTRTRQADDGGQGVRVVESRSGRTVTDLDTGVTLEEEYGAHPRWGISLPQMRRQTLEVPVGDDLYRREVAFEHRVEGESEVFETTEDDRVWQTRIAYLDDGYHTTFTTPEGRQTFAEFDALGRLTRAQAGELPDLEVEWNHAFPDRIDAAHAVAAHETRSLELRHPSRFETEWINAAGEHLATVVDGRLRLQSVELPDGASIELEHDVRDLVSAVHAPDRDAHYFESDIRGLSTFSLPPAFSADAPLLPTTQAFNMDGQPTCVKMPDERMVWHGYDADGRLDVIHLYEDPIAGHQCPPPGEPTSIIEYTHDEHDRLIDAERRDGLTGHTVRIEAHPDGLRPDATRLVVDDQLIGETRVDVGLDMRAEAIEINQTRLPIERDRDGLVLRVGAMRLRRTHPDTPGHDGGLGSIEGAIFEWQGQHLETDYTFGPWGEIASKSVSLNGTELYRQTFDARDPVMRLLAGSEVIGEDVVDSVFEYDVRGRLVDAQVGEASSTYAYDRNNNLTQRTLNGVETLAEVDGQDRLTTFGDARFTYNAMGQLTAIQGADEEPELALSYDLSGNLVQAIGPDGTVIEYIVDAADRRVGRRVDGGDWRYFLWLGDVLMAEIDADSNMLRRYVYGTRSTTPDAMIAFEPGHGETAFAIVHDHRGSVRMVVDLQTEEVVQRIDYDPFGRVLADTNPGFQPFGFTGGLYEPLTGLVRLDARDYHAETQRWTAKDPIDFAGGDTNLYAYVGNDPINRTDPSGLAWEDDVASFFAGLGDALTFGLTKKMRDGLGVGDLVDECSGSYSAGGWTADIGSLGAGALRGIGRRVGRRLGRPRPMRRGCRVGANSFVEGTRVMTSQGEVPIEDIELGDWVLTEGESGPELQQVTNRFVGQTESVWAVTVRFEDGRTTVLKGTAEHPVYVPSLGRWVEMQHLVAGMDLRGLGEDAVVEAVERELLRAAVYNLSVDQTRSFFAAGVLVHNSTQPPCGWHPSSAAQNRVPSAWGPGRPNKKGDGMRWQNPANPGDGIRIDRGNPANSQISQQVDHVIVRHQGKVVGRSGAPLPGPIKDHAIEAHIPLSEWMNWTSWFSP
jgi:RHS repeat-associated protein